MRIDIYLVEYGVARPKHIYGGDHNDVDVSDMDMNGTDPVMTTRLNVAIHSICDDCDGKNRVLVSDYSDSAYVIRSGEGSKDWGTKRETEDKNEI